MSAICPVTLVWRERYYISCRPGKWVYIRSGDSVWQNSDGRPPEQHVFHGNLPTVPRCLLSSRTQVGYLGGEMCRRFGATVSGHRQEEQQEEDGNGAATKPPWGKAGQSIKLITNCNRPARGCDLYLRQVLTTSSVGVSGLC